MSEVKQKVSIMWFRRDLRLEDNAALHYALKSSLPVIPLFIFDRNILDDFEDKYDRRVEFIHAALTEMQSSLLQLKSSLLVIDGNPLDVFRNLVEQYDVNTVYANCDYEQYAIDRDNSISIFLKQKEISFCQYKDQVIFDKEEVVKDDGTPYMVFTPYSKKWKMKLNDFYLSTYPCEKYYKHFYRFDAGDIPSLKSLGFFPVDQPFPSKELPDEIVKQYHQDRDYPAIPGTSRLSVHLRFGTISIRKLVAHAKKLNEVFLNELIWREFYHMILWHVPHVRKGESYKREFDKIKWRNNEKEFMAWCEGRTGYPIVDAGMRELNATGFMHNRVRMITASFLTKHLLIDWRWGEAYFAKKLLDYDYAANNGGWQWCAGTGCDASPYFRVFNPALQTKKFDRDLKYIKEWVPELNSFEYPQPIVEHDMARQRAIQVYRQALVSN
ncbi:MAG: deoxyribodipyrimidine photo-lyase [Chitinophagaceae bacterium]|nr:deoxyribodipyrimidine photo-lyase [Chitinophagaceae bacterium]